MAVYRRLSVLSFFFKQKTAYELRISDWSSDVCSSDLLQDGRRRARRGRRPPDGARPAGPQDRRCLGDADHHLRQHQLADHHDRREGRRHDQGGPAELNPLPSWERDTKDRKSTTSELQSLMRNSYAVFCLKKKKQH